jgi:hypothetical protein
MSEVHLRRILALLTPPERVLGECHGMLLRTWMPRQGGGRAQERERTTNLLIITRQLIQKSTVDGAAMSCREFSRGTTPLKINLFNATGEGLLLF